MRNDWMSVGSSVCLTQRINVLMKPTFSQIFTLACLIQREYTALHEISWKLEVVIKLSDLRTWMNLKYQNWLKDRELRSSLQLSETKGYMNAVGHTCASYQHENIYIPCHLHLVPPNVNTWTSLQFYQSLKFTWSISRFTLQRCFNLFLPVFIINDPPSM